MRNVTLLPAKIALQCARALGRGERTLRFLAALSQPQPRAWELVYVMAFSIVTSEAVMIP